MVKRIVAPTLSLEITNERAVSSLTRGLVGDSSFAILPEITSRTTFIVTLIAQLVSFTFVCPLLTEASDV
jgi:alpha-1,3-glucosyltransferase